MPGRQGRGGAKSAPRGKTSTTKAGAKKTSPKKSGDKASAKKPAARKAAAAPKKGGGTVGGKSGKPPAKAGYGREDHRHALDESPTSRKKLTRETTGVDEDLDYGAGISGHRDSDAPAAYEAGRPIDDREFADAPRRAGGTAKSGRQSERREGGPGTRAEVMPRRSRSDRRPR